MNRLVSILIPCYNSEKWIAETIQSAIDQTWENKEIIIVDDGSTDNSLEIVKHFTSSNVKIFSQKNQSAGTARNRALREAQGDFIQFLDADDILSIEKIKAQMNILMDNPDKVAVCNTIHFYDGEDYLGKSVDDEWYLYDTDDPVEFLIKLYGGYGQGGMIQPNAYLTPRSVIEKAGFWEEFYSPDDDGEYFCRVLLSSSGVRFIKNGLNYYRKHFKSQNLSRVNSRIAMEGIIHSLDLKAEHILHKTSSDKAKYALARQYLEHAVKSYPAYKDISLGAIKKAKSLGLEKIEYVGGSRGHQLAKFFGWKVARLVSYFLYEVK